MLGFIEIPEGTFLMGSDLNNDPDVFESEQPRHEVHLPAYYISRYLVTVAQFRFFVSERGDDFDEWQSNIMPNHPVVEVSWYDALRYCDWLQGKLFSVIHQRLAESELNPTARAFWLGLSSGNMRVTLPSEAEWEKAARGIDGQIYPWGNEFDPGRANTIETGLGGTSAVGCFRGAPAHTECWI